MLSHRKRMQLNCWKWKADLKHPPIKVDFSREKYKRRKKCSDDALALLSARFYFQFEDGKGLRTMWTIESEYNFRWIKYTIYVSSISFNCKRVMCKLVFLCLCIAFATVDRSIDHQSYYAKNEEIAYAFDSLCWLLFRMRFIVFGVDGEGTRSG